MKEVIKCIKEHSFRRVISKDDGSFELIRKNEVITNDNNIIISGYYFARYNSLRLLFSITNDEKVEVVLIKLSSKEITRIPFEEITEYKQKAVR